MTSDAPPPSPKRRSRATASVSAPPTRAPSHLYLLPGASGEDILKLGMSRDPLSRMQAFHRRYFEEFDLDRGLIVETETVRDARALELLLGRRMKQHNAPAPLLIRREAGGHTEWYRGAYEPLADAVRSLRDDGYTVHEPLRPWVRAALVRRGDDLFSWASGALEQAALRDEGHGLDRLLPEERRLIRDVLDAYVAVDIDLEPLLPAEVFDWHRG